MPEFYELLGDKALMSTLSSLGDPRMVKDIMKPAVNKGLTPINKEAKRLVGVKTGNLRKSLGKKVKVSKGMVIGKITARKGYSGAAKYAHMQEFGTRRMKARSFLRKALYNKQQQSLSIVSETAWNNIVKQVDRAVRLGRMRYTAGGGIARVI